MLLVSDEAIFVIGPNALIGAAANADHEFGHAWLLAEGEERARKRKPARGTTVILPLWHRMVQVLC